VEREKSSAVRLIHWLTKSIVAPTQRKLAYYVQNSKRRHLIKWALRLDAPGVLHHVIIFFSGPATRIAEKLNRTVAGVVYAMRRGEKLAKQQDFKLLKK